MPRLNSRPPRYCHHKATNRAVVYLNGKAEYLGLYNSSGSKEAYKRIVAECAPADITLERIGEFLSFDLATLLAAATK